MTAREAADAVMDACFDPIKDDTWRDWPKLVAHRDRIEAAILAHEAEGWRPISEAPRDGTAVLLYPNEVVATWDFGAENWLVLNIFLNEDHTISADWTKKPAMWFELMADIGGMSPTHFCLLPPPPEVKL